jgi:hypothetical protein
MKKLYTLLLFVFAGFIGHSQIITFPDANFKARLLSATTSNGIAKNQAGLSVVIDTNGDSQIQLSEALVIYQLTLNGNGITSMVGIENFTNLRKLSIASASITSLNINGLSNLTDFVVDGSPFLTSLNVNGLSNLINFNCANNQLTSVSLTDLSNLVYFKCDNNDITSITITNVPNLTNIYCHQNQLTSLNMTGMSHLVELWCYSNQLTSLTLTGCSALRYLYANANLLTSLNLNDCAVLFYLRCYSNSLSNLDLSHNPQLKWAECYSNLLTSINVEGCSQMTELKADHNLLTTLDISDTMMEDLYVNNNQLTSLFVKNGSFETLFYIMNNPNLSYICCDDSQLTSIQNGLVTNGIPFCTVNTYCSFTPGGSLYGTIQGNVRFDWDENGCDANDYDYPVMKFNVVSGSVTGNYFADGTGFYHIPLPNGNYSITPQFENSSYFNISPSNVILTVPTVVNPYIQDFCIQPAGVHNDLEIVMLPLGRARPGFDASYKIIYKNKGNHIQNGVINLSFNDAVLDLVNATPSIESTDVNTLNWSFTNLYPFETREIQLILNLNSPVETPPLSSGSVLHYTATIIGAVDETPNDNSSSLAQGIVNALDPNDKTCLEGITITPSMVGEYIHYIIRFENTGTADAENIVVKDIIDTAKFDIATLIPLSGSAPYVTRITNTNQVEFIFENINLPFDDADNDGYVAFKIKTKPTLVLGSTFSNSASIFFDFNPAVITNTATTTVAALASADFDFGNYFSVSPNPAKQVLNLETKGTIGVKSIEIYNLLGQMVIAIPNAETVSAIDVSDLKTGTYFIKVKTDKGTSNTKFIKN